MSRYIDAEALTDYMLDHYNDLCEKYGDYDHYNTGYGDAIDAIENAPTADVVEVVRCKDCKYAEHCYDNVFDCRCPVAPWASDEYAVFTNENDFCSYGERSENGK